MISIYALTLILNLKEKAGRDVLKSQRIRRDISFTENSPLLDLVHS